MSTTLDRALGAGAILLAVPVSLASWGYGVGSPRSPGAGFWPLLIAATMAGLGTWLILQPAHAPAAGATTVSRWGRFGIALGTLAFYAVALESLGYLLATGLLLFIQLRWVEGRSFRMSAWTAVVTALVSLLLFRTALKVPLPVGVIPLPRGW